MNSNMIDVTISVLGTPAPQGSKSPWGTESNPATRPWRATVAAEARDAMEGMAPLVGPLALELVFRMPRPKAHYRTGKHAQELKLSAPFWCAKTPDVDKLIRAVGDALTTAGVWRDDSQVTSVSARKVYATGRFLPGVEIRVRGQLDEFGPPA